ncbi:MAG TPA: T9SS type A sorting domain-containing protein [Candidatus Kapabacteria bacterium]|nr:T9SS type A sorting domain-containing protein [Candidatus Kapabacteria bacterium]
MKKYFSLSVTIFVALLISRDVRAQNCGQSCYPYYFCPPASGQKTPQILCEPCPHNVPGLIPFAPGVPCVTIDNLYSDPTGAYYIDIDFLDGNGPKEVFDPTQAQTDISAALDVYTIICPDVKSNKCCDLVVLETDPTVWDQTYDPVTGHPGYDPLSNPAFSIIPIDAQSCTIADCSALETVLNFTNEFLTGNVNGDPSAGDPIIQAYFTTNDENNIPSTIPYGFKVFSLRNYVAHEFGHILGYPEEDLVPSSCELDGVMQFPSSNTESITGLTVKEACWFKQLYCPDACPSPSPCATSGVSEGPGATNPYTFVSVAPNPFNRTTALAYTLGDEAFVSTQVFDILGREIGKATSSMESQGSHTFEFNAPALNGGVFYIRVEVNGSVHSYRVVATGSSR